MEPIFTAATVIDEKAYAQMLLAKQRLDQRWLMIPVYLLALPAVWAMTFRIEQPHSLFGWVLRIFVLALTAAVIPPIWPRVQPAFGAKVVAEVPEVIPFSAAH